MSDVRLRFRPSSNNFKGPKGRLPLAPGERLVCHCPAARPDEIGQCTRCWRPIVALHPILHDAWPELVDQPIEQPGAA